MVLAKQGSEIAVYKRFESTMQLMRHLSTLAPIPGVSVAAAGYVRREIKSVANTGISRLKLLQHTMEELRLECFEEENRVHEGDVETLFP